MAKKISKKPKIKVTKFGEYKDHVSTEKVKETYTSELTGEVVKELDYDVSTVQAQSDVKLEDDLGSGHAVIMRMFEFGANPIAFKQYKPTKQELFNSHAKQIELTLWGDGLQVMPEVNPTVTINKKKTKYRIFVGAIANKGVLFSHNDKPQTLSKLIKS